MPQGSIIIIIGFV